MDNKTDNMQECLHREYDFIYNYIIAKKYSPSFEEIKEACGLRSKASVSVHLCKLKELGYIDYDPFISRSIILKKYQYILKNIPSQEENNENK